jgi:hypothetical protein
VAGGIGNGSRPVPAGNGGGGVTTEGAIGAVVTGAVAPPAVPRGGNVAVPIGTK